MRKHIIRVNKYCNLCFHCTYCFFYIIFKIWKKLYTEYLLRKKKNKENDNMTWGKISLKSFYWGVFHTRLALSFISCFSIIFKPLSQSLIHLFLSVHSHYSWFLFLPICFSIQALSIHSYYPYFLISSNL